MGDTNVNKLFTYYINMYIYNSIYIDNDWLLVSEFNTGTFVDSCVLLLHSCRRSQMVYKECIGNAPHRLQISVYHSLWRVIVTYVHWQLAHICKVSTSWLVQVCVKKLITYCLLIAQSTAQCHLRAFHNFTH